MTLVSFILFNPDKIQAESADATPHDEDPRKFTA
jgi:hypothetical protein